MDKIIRMHVTNLTAQSGRTGTSTQKSHNMIIVGQKTTTPINRSKYLYKYI